MAFDVGNGRPDMQLTQPDRRQPDARRAGRLQKAFAKHEKSVGRARVVRPAVECWHEHEVPEVANRLGCLDVTAQPVAERDAVQPLPLGLGHTVDSKQRPANAELVREPEVAVAGEGKGEVQRRGQCLGRQP